MANTVTLLYVGLGLFFATLAVPLALGRVPPNRVYGFRTERTLSSPDIWYAVNRSVGVELGASGLILAASAVGLRCGWSAASPEGLAIADTFVLLASVLVVTVRGYAALARL